MSVYAIDDVALGRCRFEAATWPPLIHDLDKLWKPMAVAYESAPEARVEFSI